MRNLGGFVTAGIVVGAIAGVLFLAGGALSQLVDFGIEVVDSMSNCLLSNGVITEAASPDFTATIATSRGFIQLSVGFGILSALLVAVGSVKQ